MMKDILFLRDYVSSDSALFESCQTEYQYPLLIDADKAERVLAEKLEKNPRENEIFNAVNLSRLSFMGTDGMRGKVDLSLKENCISALVNKNIISAEIIELSSFAYAKTLMAAGKLKKGDSVCIGNDSRDVSSGWKLNEAMRNGFLKCGINVIDLGVIPTPFIPLYMLQNQLVGGAMLTASHNPSNQNGIKFFFEGKKILPEGIIGDYALSYFMFKYLDQLNTQVSSGVCRETSFINESLEFLDKIIPVDLFSKLVKHKLFLDSANGAYTDLAIRFFQDKNMEYSLVNEKPTGFNINQNCGVAEIEGCDFFDRKDCGSSTKIVCELFNEGERNKKDAFGIVLDGDGDRGFILYYHSKTDRVWVLDGDKCGYLIARHRIKDTKLKKPSVVFTVESDVMAVASLKGKWGIDSVRVDVGDKWICNYTKTEMLLGLESSGHIIIPTDIDCPYGKRELRAGNGLYSCLLTLHAIFSSDFTASEIYEPYASGFSKTDYTYFIDKTKFSNNSMVWKTDNEILQSTIKECVFSEKDKPIRFKRELKEDKNMLYYSIYEDGNLVGSIFSRNSGTEDKNAVYLKCRIDLAEKLTKMTNTIRDLHRESLKKTQSDEVLCESIILNLLKVKNPVSLVDIADEIKLKQEKEVKRTDLMAVLYAMKKENYIYSIGDQIYFVEDPIPSVDDFKGDLQ